MQGLADGYFIIPYTVGNYLAANRFARVDESRQEIQNTVTTVRETIINCSPSEAGGPSIRSIASWAKLYGSLAA
jgi:hypothetical protein